MFAEVRANPLGNKGRRRLSSLAGVQDKVLIARVRDSWAEPLDGFPSTHILKPQSGKYLSLIFDEEYGSRFARALGLADFDTHIETFADRRALVIQRYDRDGEGNRLHQEDFNQALGHRGDEKYESVDGDGRLRAIAAVLREHAAMTELHKLARMMTLSVAVGNLDMHAKNLSVLHGPGGEVALAPMYDVVPQLHLDVDEDVALLVNGVQPYADITGADLVAEVESWRVRGARDLVRETLEQVLAVADSERPLAGAAASLDETIKHLADRLLNSLPPEGTSTHRRRSGKPRKQQQVFESRNAPGGWGGPVR